MNPLHSSTPLAVVLRGVPRILRDTLAVAVLVALGSLLVPNRFTGVTTVMPPHSGGDLLGAVLGLPDAGALSRTLGLESSSETNTYLAVLRSGTVRSAIARRFDLARVYAQKDPEKVARQLTRNTAVSVTTEGLIKVAVTDRQPRRAADMANAYVEELDRVLRASTNTSARRRREFLERRLAECRVEVARAEDALRDHLVAKRLPAAGADAGQMGEALGELMAQRVQREVELGTLESVARAPSPRAEALRNEIRQIDAQVVKVPPAATELARLAREVRIQEKVLLVLTEEYERARILEQKDVPVVEVLDRADPPLHHSSPRRVLIALAALLVAFAARATLEVTRERARSGAAA